MTLKSYFIHLIYLSTQLPFSPQTSFHPLQFKVNEPFLVYTLSDIVFHAALHAFIHHAESVSRAHALAKKKKTQMLKKDFKTQ